MTDLSEKLGKILSGIRPADPEIYMQALRCWNSIAKPLDGLGILEKDIAKIAALRGSMDVSLQSRMLMVICADNGVVSQGISQSDASVSEAVSGALGQGKSTVNYQARAARCRVTAVDAGMLCRTPEGVQNRKIRRGTDDISCGPAMTRSQCEQAILLGVSLVEELVDADTDILLTGEMGIGNTTTAAAVSSLLLSRDPEELVGRGAGLTDEGLQKKTQVIRRALLINQPDPTDPVDILQKTGGLDLAVLCGLCLGGAFYRLPVLLDGVITNAAALCAVRLNPAVSDALIASHQSSEPAAGLLLQEMNLHPYLCGGFHLGEGSGAVLALPLLDQALAVYQSGHTFDQLKIEAYTRLSDE